MWERNINRLPPSHVLTRDQSNLQPRNVPWQRTELPTFRCAGRHPKQLTHLARFRWFFFFDWGRLLTVLSRFHTPCQGPNQQLLRGQKNRRKERNHFAAFLSCLASWPFQSWQLWLLFEDQTILHFILFSFHSSSAPGLFWYKLLLHSQKWKSSSLKFFFPKKCTRWHIFLFNENVFLLALNMKDNLT